MQITKKQKFIPLLNPKETLKKLLIQFSQDENIDKEVLKSNFQIEEFEKSFIFFVGNAECKYSCGIGFNREESYIATETRKELINGKWQNVTKQVNKTRTITDWSPHSGTESGTDNTILSIDGEYDRDALDIQNIIEKLEHEECDCSIEVSENLLKKGRNGVFESFAVGIKMNLPGDKQRDFSCSGKAEITSAHIISIPFYKISYAHNGKERILEINACKPDFSVPLEDCEKSPLKYQPLNTQQIAGEKFKKLAKVRNIAWISIIPFVVFAAFHFILSILSCVVIAVAIFLTVKHAKLYSAYKKELDEIEKKKRDSILDDKHKEVYKVLCETFKNYELEPCSFEEVYHLK